MAVINDSLMAAIVADVKTLTESGLDDSFVERVIKRLGSLGYDVTQADAEEIAFCATKVVQDIYNYCNITELPKGAVFVAVNMVCGEFFQAKYNSGLLSLEGLSSSGSLSSVKLGDTQVSFNSDSVSDDDKIQGLISSLIGNWKGALECFRRMRF